MKFIDLFAGLGGFNLALKHIGHECVFASELNPILQSLYEKNFGIRPYGDIRNIQLSDIPEHDILCAGFPCQPFSKAGEQKGFEHPKWGDLFDHVINIIKFHNPRYLMLENVPNIIKHNDGKTWLSIKDKLIKSGYILDSRRLSPHHFGIPQIRERIFIVGSLGSLDNFTWPKMSSYDDLSIIKELDDNPLDARGLSPQVIECLEKWQEFLTRYPSNLELPSFPIWSMEFGATYPYEEKTPFSTDFKELGRYLGSHGELLKNLSEDSIMMSLPSYARTREEKFPDWKIQFIKQNRELYSRNKVWIDEWKEGILKFPSSLQKFEWNCKGVERNLWELIIQFRASGVRVKRPRTAPSLIAMTATQVPIIGWQKRYMTAKECARLQSMEELLLPNSVNASYKALGNAVNVKLVEIVAQNLLCQLPSEPVSVESPLQGILKFVIN